MREIKFRAFQKDIGMLIYPKKHYAPNYKDGHLAEMYNPEENKYHIIYNEDVNFVLMQYTGLKDKNGKELFEGDIVKCKWKEDLSEKNNEWIIECKPIGQDTFHFYSEFEDIDFEIIGNKFENFELLK